MGSILDKIYEEKDETFLLLQRDKDKEHAAIWNHGINGMEFTHVEISEIITGVWVGEFSYSYAERRESIIHTSISGDSSQMVIRKVEKFLCKNLRQGDYLYLNFPCY